MKINVDRLTREIVSESDELINNFKLLHNTFASFQEYLINGNRLNFEKVYFERRRHLAVLALQVIIEPSNVSAIRCLEEVIWDICNEYTWALPAHLPNNKKTFTNKSPETIDLFAAETAQSLSEIIEIHSLLLSVSIKERVYEEVNRRVIKPFESKEWFWEQLENNWSSVIASCIGMIILSLPKVREERKTKIIKRLNRTFEHYLSGFKEDGVCEEGLSYWVYGFGYFCYFTEKYKKYYNEHFINPTDVKNIAAFPFYSQLGNSHIPFSDVSHVVLPSGLMSFCQKEYDVPVPYIKEAPSFHFDHCYRWAHLYRNLTWVKPIQKETKKDIYYFNKSEWLVCHLDNESIRFASKAGNNNESHNHNDVGHFVLGTDTELYLTDIGAGEYTKDYFSEDKRYTILNNRSYGHSLPLINNREQIAGNVKANDVSFIKDDENFKFSMSLEDVYSKNSGLKHYQRSWKWCPKDKVIYLQDHMIFNSNSNNKVQQHFISPIEPKIEKNKIVWRGGNGRLVLIYEDCVDTPHIKVERYKNHYGDINEAYILSLNSDNFEKEYRRNYQFIMRKN